MIPTGFEKLFIIIFVKYAKYLPHIYKIINNLISVFNVIIKNLNLDFNISNIEMNDQVEKQLTSLNELELSEKLKDENEIELNKIMMINMKIIMMYSMIMVTFTTLGISIVTNIIGFLYPLYTTINVVEKGTSLSDSNQWLIYWIVYSSFTFFENIFAFLINIIPFYHYLKLAFLLILVKKEEIRIMLYKKYFKTMHNRYEEEIDDVISKAKDSLVKKIS